MPIYGFTCKMCKQEFESLVHGNVEAGERCTNCGSTATEREDFPKKGPAIVVNGASAANNYGLKPERNSKKRRLY
jgi:putative FmdB family regulatory protein